MTKKYDQSRKCSLLFFLGRRQELCGNLGIEVELLFRNRSLYLQQPRTSDLKPVAVLSGEQPVIWQNAQGEARPLLMPQSVVRAL